jgi:predicted phosphoribosyltransferase
MRAAVRGLKQQGARAVVVAAPVVSVEALKVLQREAHQVLCVQCPDPFMAVGAWYRDFSQTTDDEVCSLLAEARRLVRKEPTA